MSGGSFESSQRTEPVCAFAIFFNKELFQNPGLRVGSWSWVEQNRTVCPTVRWPYPIVRSIPFYVYVESSQRLVFTCSCGVLQGILM